MWNPTVALGTVTHEYIGYLLPMGPFYALAAAVHVPTWVAQRLWLGGILFAAGAGVLYLSRVLAVRGPGRVVAALGVHAVAILPPVRRPHLGHPPPLGRTAVDGRLRRPRRAPRRLAVPRALRPRRRRRQRDQRQLDHLRRHRAGAVADLCRRHRAGGHVAPGRLGRPQDGPPHLPLLSLVDRRAGDRGRLRRRRPPVHRDRPVDQPDVERGRGHPRPRLLVLLRRRPPRPVDDIGRPLHPAALATRAVLSRARPRLPVRRPRPLAPPGLLRPARRRRRRPLRRRPPDHQPDAGRRRPQDLHDRHDRRPRHALDRPGDPAGRPRPGHAARRRRHRPVGPAAPDRARHRTGRRRPRRRQQPGRLQRRRRGLEQLRPAGQAARVPDAGHRPPQRHPSRDPRPGHPRQRLRGRPLGRHRRHAPIGLPDPAVRHPRAADHGLDGHRRHPLRARRADADKHRQLEFARARWPGS